MVRNAILEFTNIQHIHDDFVVEVESIIKKPTGDEIGVLFRVPLVHVRRDGHYNMFNPESQVNDSKIQGKKGTLNALGVVEKDELFDIVSSEDILRDHYDNLLMTQTGSVPDFGDLVIYIHVGVYIDVLPINDEVFFKRLPGYNPGEYQPTLTPVMEEE